MAQGTLYQFPEFLAFRFRLLDLTFSISTFSILIGGFRVDFRGFFVLNTTVIRVVCIDLQFCFGFRFLSLLFVWNYLLKCFVRWTVLSFIRRILDYHFFLFKSPETRFSCSARFMGLKTYSSLILLLFPLSVIVFPATLESSLFRLDFCILFIFSLAIWPWKLV